jgi:hypothetical protein
MGSKSYFCTVLSISSLIIAEFKDLKYFLNLRTNFRRIDILTLQIIEKVLDLTQRF